MKWFVMGAVSGALLMASLVLFHLMTKASEGNLVAQIVMVAIKEKLKSMGAQ